jgi:hypothetical protein
MDKRMLMAAAVGLAAVHSTVPPYSSQERKGPGRSFKARRKAKLKQRKASQRRNRV